MFAVSFSFLKRLVLTELGRMVKPHLKQVLVGTPGDGLGFPGTIDRKKCRTQGQHGREN